MLVKAGDREGERSCHKSPRRSQTDEPGGAGDACGRLIGAVAAAAPVLPSSRSRDAAKRSTTRVGPCRSGGGARTPTPSRSQRAALRCAWRP